MDKEQILVALFLLSLSGCRWGRKPNKPVEYRSSGKSIQYEVDADFQDDEVRSFFGDGEDLLSETEFQEWAVAQEITDLGEEWYPIDIDPAMHVTDAIDDSLDKDNVPDTVCSLETDMSIVVDASAAIECEATHDTA